MSGYCFDKLKIAVVAENPHLRKLVATITRAFGVRQILEAAGEDAWPMLCACQPDIVLLGWSRDLTATLALVTRIRAKADSPMPFVPIILLCASSDSTQIRRARDAGINEILAGSLSARALMTRITSAIEHPRPFVRTGSYFGPCRRYRASDEYRGPDRRTSSHARYDEELAAA